MLCLPLRKRIYRHRDSLVVYFYLTNTQEARNSRETRMICEKTFTLPLMLCSREPYIDELQMLYNIQEYISAENTPRDSYAQLLHFILVPIFSVHHRFFFRELMSLTSTTVLYYRLYESETTTRVRIFFKWRIENNFI